ncbi:hypothetical protein YC2023_011754 [Brassica napus]
MNPTNTPFLGQTMEIWLREETVRSTQKLHELVDWWVQTTPVAERKSGMVGRSAAGFVMKLHYSDPGRRGARKNPQRSHRLRSYKHLSVEVAINTAHRSRREA